MDVSRETIAAAAPFLPSTREWDQLSNYAELLSTIGVERGLLGPKEPERIWERHILNCLPVASLVTAPASVADIGSGAGLPGIVLAIAKPSVEVTLVEPLLRRSQFLLQIKELLDLPNVVVSRARAEDVAKDMVGTFDCVTSRAVAPLDRLLSWSLPLTKPGGYVLAIKGAKAQQEVVDAAAVLGGWNCPHPRIHDVVIGLDRTRVVQVQRPVRSNSQEKKKSSRSRGGQSRRTS